jgi:hypothetical protein
MVLRPTEKTKWSDYGSIIKNVWAQESQSVFSLRLRRILLMSPLKKETNWG